ncbi:MULTISPECIES: ABC transporter ATP-binding protein [unclassified Wenzhouxiangella]|uniref:ABC transporter ATP-binding protein n=1 Tax=unclassified Wenzhouxiangella TaxID=2613841 RepID=UPI000E3273DE|nr:MULTISPECIES: ABC transporter ATP-binding protein [unclassified Wenzhouxiangella]RFF27687.1 ABC transporter ATP-binding protein [Wenzhouxiangella sp. 15181]RFP69778.1 ABC transporter ATP-binding protein [Wenzhouxiangella sp. 15190]
MTALLSIENLDKRYAGGLHALKSVDLDIERGEIFALLGPNGAGKTTLINIVCGIVTPTSGHVTVDGRDTVREFRWTRRHTGLVPQELFTDMFETVHDTVSFSRGLFGLAPDPDHIERVLRDLSLWDKRDSPIMTLSGGMKRRVLIAKALAHEPKLLFLDEPTAGVDVELRRDMWRMIEKLRGTGVTIVLTTHYIEEAERMADRVGVIRRGEIILVEETDSLMKKLGRKHLSLHLEHPMSELPASLNDWTLTLADRGRRLDYSFAADEEHSCVPVLLKRLQAEGIEFTNLNTRQSTLEEIFVDLVHEDDDVHEEAG